MFQWALKCTSTIEGEIIDPFARKCPWGTITNDIDENQPTNFHLDGADFLQLQGDQTAKIILFDPPFSGRQAEKYEVGDLNLYGTGDGRIGRMNQCMARIIKPGGIILKLGYNTSRPHKSLTLKRVSILTFGGTRNDVLISAWMRENRSLEDWL